MQSNNSSSPEVSREVQWHDNPSKPIPQHVIQMLVVDTNCQMLLFKRTGRTDSACDVWSMPSGRHEIGESVMQTIERELDEEFGLEMQSATLFGQYENIAGDTPDNKQYHWVITLYLVIVNDITKLENKEPDKHSDVTFTHYRYMLNGEFYEMYPFHPTLDEYLQYTAENIVEMIDHRLNDLGI